MATPWLKNKIVRYVGGGVIGVATTIAVNNISTSEGFSPVVYKDPIGLNTYCYGETSNPNPQRVYSKEYCQFLLSHKAAAAIREVRALVPNSVYLSPQELAAWGSFTYNVGSGAFKSSTALKLLKQGRRRGACAQLSRWVYATEIKTGKSVRLKGLENRRKTERELCEKGVSEGEV